VARAAGRRALRDLWLRAQADGDISPSEVARLADHAEVADGWLAQAILGAARLGPLLLDFERRARWQRTPELVDIRDAIDGLRRWLEPYRRPGALPPTFARHLAAARPSPAPARRPFGLTPAPRPEILSPTLEQIEAIPEVAAPLTPPPQVA
jgi:hypothetical protein